MRTGCCTIVGGAWVCEALGHKLINVVVVAIVYAVDVV
jgi:hypothetical protein